MSQKRMIIDGAVAATKVAYAMSDIATIYPISPIAEMGEVADQWSVAGKNNLFGRPMEVRELESELGAAGAAHGAACGGALATTFTCSQGLLLMIPNMYKMAGEMLPVVFHVGARTVATHALSIYGDHSDVMAVRATGFSMLASSSVQECHDLAIVAHLAAINSSMPMLHFFDAYRTANEMQTAEIVDDDDLSSLIDMGAVARFRARAMNPEHSDVRGTAQNPDVFFQNSEACNNFYASIPATVQRAMDDVARVTGRSYHLFDYVGAADAEYITISMGSSCEVIEQTVDYLNSRGYKVGHVKVRLYRPFSAEALAKAIPATAKVVAVLDRDKEPGALGEPLYVDVVAALAQTGRGDIKVIGGRYGLSSKDFNVGMAKAVFDEMAKPEPRREFTVGINDDVTGLSLDYDPILDPISDEVTQVIFYGIGGDGTVGATKQAANIIGGSDQYYAQAHFHYSAKKSFGYTISELRYSKQPISAAYDIVAADYVGCNKPTYVGKYDMLARLKRGGMFVLNSLWTPQQMETKLPASFRRQLAEKQIRFFNVDALSIAQRHGLGTHINTIMEMVFFKLMNPLPIDQVTEAIKQQVTAMYIHEGQNVVDANIAAVNDAIDAITEIAVPSAWATADLTDEAAARKAYLATLPQWVREVAEPMNRMEGDKLPVSKMSPDGVIPSGESAYEKRKIADFIPIWDSDKCIECVECSFVCSHATIRPFVATSEEMAGAPETYVVKDSWSKALAGTKWRIQVYPDDCTGCASCATVCPAKALTMEPVEQHAVTERANLEFAQTHISSKAGAIERFSILGSQLYTPLLEFSGACGGCGETPYVKLLTQLFGERAVIANATGCSSIWGADSPSTVYCRNENGLGPAWGNSLFEDNAEYAYGIAEALDCRRRSLAAVAREAVADAATPATLKEALSAWLAVADDPDKSYTAGLAVKKAIAGSDSQLARRIAVDADLLGKKSVWAVGGDGWAYDIGFAGLDHVLASGIDINILVLDTQCYSNTGGQTSKATPHGACTKYDYDGKKTFAKNLGEMMMTYRNVYVASVAIGGNMNQTVAAFREAEAYPGPSIIIAYCPCLNFGIKKSLSHSIIVQREAVESDFWPIYRFNPAAENPLTIDSSERWQPGAAGSPALPAPPAWTPKPWVHENIISFGESAPRNGADNPLIVDSGNAEPQPLMPMLDGENRFAVLPDRTSQDSATAMFDALEKSGVDNVTRLKNQPA